MVNPTDTLPSKEPRTAAAGPYGHPFHPIAVTLPIGSWVGAVILDLGSYAVDDPTGLPRGAFWLIAVGIIGAVVAALLGLLDFLTIPSGTPAARTGLAHMAINTVVLVLFVVSYLVRRGDDFTDSSNRTGFALALVGVVLLAVSGWLGGMLAYRYGVRVAREETQATGYR
jgi:uncharacterized membrane protein